MKKIISIIFLILFIILISNAEIKLDTRADFGIIGATNEISVAPDESIWIATRTGGTYYTNNITEDWHYGYFKYEEFIVSDFGKSFERIQFFNNDTAVISGYIYGQGSKTDIIYWTGNRGKTFEPIVFGEPSWIDAYYSNDKGEAWMSGSSQLIYYSKDYGKTWKSFPKIKPNSTLRLNTIYFEDSMHGIVGSVSNAIYKTDDNCQSWLKLPTPLQQKKYQRIYANERPKIHKVIYLNKYIFVNQQNHIFYSSRDSIDWICFPGVIDFELDKDNQRLYLITKDLSVKIISRNLTEIWTSKTKLVYKPIALKVRNGNLFSWHGDEIYRINENSYSHRPIYTSDVPIKKPYEIHKTATTTWGVSGKHIYQLKYGSKWHRVIRLDTPVWNFKALSDSTALITTEMGKKHSFFSIEQDSLKNINLIKPLDDFLADDIVEVTFDEGSQGCFHQYNNLLTYKLKKDSIFEVKTFYTESENKYNKNYKNRFNISECLQLINLINSENLKKLKYDDFHITDEDQRSFLEKLSTIKSDFNRGNTHNYQFGLEYFSMPYIKPDFIKFEKLLSKIYLLTSNDLGDIFNKLQGNYSTTTNWLRLKITNESGEKIVIFNIDENPNAWYLPWVVDYEGIRFLSNQIAISMFIEKYTPEGFMSDELKNTKAVFQMVDYLYRQNRDVLCN